MDVEDGKKINTLYFVIAYNQNFIKYACVQLYWLSVETVVCMYIVGVATYALQRYFKQGLPPKTNRFLVILP